MKFNLLLCFSMLCSIIHAQTFELIAPRKYNSSVWDVPSSVNLYFDSNGTLFNYINEATQPRSNELLRYNPASDTWTNLTSDSFSVPGGSGNTGGIPMADGSIFTITKSFGSSVNFQHFAYTILPNGTAVPFSADPIALGDAAGINIFPVQAPNGDIYYSHNVINVDVGKWDGTQWTELPEVAVGTLGGSSGIGVDENNDVYAVHRDNTTGHRVRFVVFDQANNTWNQLFLSSQTGMDESEIYVVSSTEIYIYYASYTQLYVVRYDGTNFTPMGNPVPGDFTFSRPGAMIKSSVTGDIYLANYIPSGNGFYKYNAATDNWDIVPNDIADGGLIVGFHPTLVEKDGCIYISGNEDNGITTVKYCPIIACAPMDLSLNFDNAPFQTSWEIQDASGAIVASSPAYSSGTNTATESLCLPDGCYDLIVNDAVGNGMCPFRSTATSAGTFITPGTLITPGSVVATLGTVVTPGLCGNYNLQDTNGNVIANGGGSFGASETNSFCITGGVPQLFVNDASYARQIPNSNESTTFRLYPNPTNDILNIEFDGNTATDIQLNIVDITGKTIHTETRAIFDSNTQLTINNLNSGIYFIQIIDNEKMMTEKFVVE